MMLARLLSKIFKNGGIILIDYTGQKYICGNPKKENPIIFNSLYVLNEQNYLLINIFIEPI